MSVTFAPNLTLWIPYPCPHSCNLVVHNKTHPQIISTTWWPAIHVQTCDGLHVLLTDWGPSGLFLVYISIIVQTCDKVILFTGWGPSGLFLEYLNIILWQVTRLTGWGPSGLYLGCRNIHIQTCDRSHNLQVEVPLAYFYDTFTSLFRHVTGRMTYRLRPLWFISMIPSHHCSDLWQVT